MLALMIEKLAGYEPLQRKILLYCFETPTATAIKTVISIFEKRPEFLKKQNKEDKNNATLWRYYNEIFNAKFNKYRGHINAVVYAELKFAKNLHIDHSLMIILERLQKAVVKYYYHLLSAPESVHGTPSCICIRGYISKLFLRGIQLRDHETLWAKFSYGEIRNRFHNNMTKLLCPTVKNDLTKAMKEMKESKQYNNHISFW